MDTQSNKFTEIAYKNNITLLKKYNTNNGVVKKERDQV